MNTITQSPPSPTEPEGQGWLPITEAQKDGSWIKVKNSQGWEGLARWCANAKPIYPSKNKGEWHSPLGAVANITHYHQSPPSPQTGSGSGSGTPRTAAVYVGRQPSWEESYEFASALERELEAEKARFKAFFDDREELRQRAQELQSTLEEARKEAAKWRNIKRPFSPEFADKVIGNQVTEMDRLRTALAADRAELEAGKAVIAKLNTEAEEDHQIITKKNRHIDELHERLASLRTALEAAGKERDEARDALESARLEIQLLLSK